MIHIYVTERSHLRNIVSQTTNVVTFRLSMPVFIFGTLNVSRNNKKTHVCMDTVTH
jgi:hypothetical protein